jgi:hypothetical protein
MAYDGRGGGNADLGRTACRNGLVGLMVPLKQNCAARDGKAAGYRYRHSHDATTRTRFEAIPVHRGHECQAGRLGGACARSKGLPCQRLHPCIVRVDYDGLTLGVCPGLARQAFRRLKRNRIAVH